jgi:hypothetical protein
VHAWPEDSNAVAVELLLDVLVDLHQKLDHNFWRRLAILSEYIEVHLAKALKCHATQHNHLAEHIAQAFVLLWWRLTKFVALFHDLS